MRDRKRSRERKKRAQQIEQERLLPPFDELKVTRVDLNGTVTVDIYSTLKRPAVPVEHTCGEGRTPREFFDCPRCAAERRAIWKTPQEFDPKVW